MTKETRQPRTIANCPVPLVFADRFFMLENLDRSVQVSVLTTHEGKPIFEVIRDKPVETPHSDTSRDGGRVSVAEKDGPVVYELEPGQRARVTLFVDGAARFIVHMDELATRIFEHDDVTGTPIHQVDNAACLNVGSAIVVERDGGIRTSMVEPPLPIQTAVLPTPGA